MFFALVFIGVIALGIQAIIGLGFFISCIAEREAPDAHRRDKGGVTGHVGKID